MIHYPADRRLKTCCWRHKGKRCTNHSLGCEICLFHLPQGERGRFLIYAGQLNRISCIIKCYFVFCIAIVLFYISLYSAPISAFLCSFFMISHITAPGLMLSLFIFSLYTFQSAFSCPGSFILFHIHIKLKFL